MATFELLEEGIYRVEGEITQEDVDRINTFQIRTCLVLQNTKGQSSEIIKQIKTDNVYFSILGGLDYYNKSKFNSSDYIERTYVAPKGLVHILKYFERIESGINPEWTDIQKCMYAYNALAVDTEYVKHLDQDILTDGVIERGLNGVLYNQLTCAGMAQTFKEMMDRLGIPCYYQNQRHIHAFNVVELDEKYRGIDVTWDCTRTDGEKCSFRNFGRDSDFYEKYGHKISRDSQETVFDLTPFTDEEIQDNYAVIEGAINERKRIVYPFRGFDRAKKKKFLPVDRFIENLQDEESAIVKLRLLEEFGTIPEEMKPMIDLTRSRYGFILDYMGINRKGIGNILDEITQSNNLPGFLKMSGKHELILVSFENGKREDSPLSQKEREEISPSLISDVKEYYTRYFKSESSHIDSLLESYSTIENMPTELVAKTQMLRAHLYTKIRLLANGDKFFEQLEIPKEDIDVVREKAKSCLERTKKEAIYESKEQHEYDLDFLYAIIQNDVIDTLLAGREYTEQDLSNLMEEVRENWKDAKFSDGEFKDLLDEALSKTMGSEEISRGTANSGIGIEDINNVISEIKRKQTRNLQKSQQK